MAPPVSTRKAAPVDVILSKYARGYRNGTMISHLLFPRVVIPNRFMQTLSFGKESFRLLNTRRAPGAKKKRIQYGFASGPLDLYQEALEGVVPEEHQSEAMKVPGVDLAQGAIQTVMDVEDLNLEFEVSKLVRNADNYSDNNKTAFAAAERWDTTNSNPRKDIDDASESIRRSTGTRPNTLTISPRTFNALRNHEKIRDQFKYVSKDSITVDMLAAYFTLDKVIVGDAVYLPETARDDDMALDVWGNDAILAYVPRDGGNYMVPAFGYTYELNGMPEVRTPYWDDTCDSWIYPMKVERREKMVGADAGFLLKDVVSDNG